MKLSIPIHTRFLLLISLCIISCTSDDRDDPIQEIPASGEYNTGVFILNEGGFGFSNASVSFLDTDGQVYRSIFSNTNATTLGDTAQSMGFNGENAYIVVNNSATIEIVNRYTFEKIARVTNMIVNPRFIAFHNNKGYITNWGDPNNPNDDYIAVLNLDTHLIEAQIPVAEGPEKMISHNGKLYVAHKGGYGYGNTISVIDFASQSIHTSIDVADVPNGLVIDNGSLYVICSGKAPFTQDETTAELFKINTADHSIETSLLFPEGIHPSFLELENNSLYYTAESKIFSIDISNFKLPQNPLFSPSTNGLEIVYGFKVNEGLIYLADAKDYVSNGEVFIYTRTGDLQKQFTVEIIPNSFYFNN